MLINVVGEFIRLEVVKMTRTTQDSVEAFKTFVRKHPELAKGVKKEGKTWKEVFEEWVLFGEGHEIWNNYGIQREGKTSQGEGLSKIWGYIKNADFDQLGEQLNQLNGALTNISELFTLFRPEDANSQSTQPFNANNQGQQQNTGSFSPSPFQQPQVPPQQPGAFQNQQPFQFRRD